MYLQQSWKYQLPEKVCDIINSGSQVSGGATCYLFAILNRWNFYDIHIKPYIFCMLR
jgi:hypothetical protein